MKILPVTPENITLVAEHIRSGGLAIHATETCYGLTCDPYNPAALATLFNAKQRPIGQHVSILVESVEQAKECTIWNKKAEELAATYWPGALTMALPAADVRIHTQLEVSTTTIAVRQSSYSTAAQLVAAVGHPIVTTSANMHRMPEAYSIEDVSYQFGRSQYKNFIVLDDGTLPPNPPSTLVQVTDDGIAVLREGAIVIA